MQLFHFLLALPALASAAEIRLRYDGGCNGGYLVCTNIGSQQCCGGIQNQRGYNSVGFVSMPRNSVVFGFQATRDGNNCGAEAARGNTGGGDNACLNFPGGGGQFAGGSYYSAGRKRRGVASAAAGASKCTETVYADALVLDDGTKFDITDMQDDMVLQLNALLKEGTQGQDVPETMKVFEVAE